MRHQMCYPYIISILISATQARKNDNLRHAMSPFSLPLLLFSLAKNFGIREATRDRSGASSRNREKKEHLEDSDWDKLRDVVGLQMLL